MENTLVSTRKENTIDDFNCRVLNQFSRWGVDVEYILNMLELSKTDSERLDALDRDVFRILRWSSEPEANEARAHHRKKLSLARRLGLAGQAPNAQPILQPFGS